MLWTQQKTKIVATIGPASDSPEVLRSLLEAGMNVARLNFSHGVPAYHAALIEKIRKASADTGRRVAIMGDLPGPKMRIGDLAKDPIELVPGENFILTTDEILGDSSHVHISFPGLLSAAKPGDHLYLDDGFLLLQVGAVQGSDLHCKVLVGGELRSRKGVNLPGIDLGISAFTDNDLKWLQFAAENKVDAISQSFVASGKDITDVRQAAQELNYHPFIIAKIERANVLDKLEEVLEAADGIMVARGDLGVEIRIERIAVVQKKIIDLANRYGKPVITATQMLESMVTFRRPTRAEVTDVADAILDGTDCVMLSGESAMGRYPEESVRVLARIAQEVEPERSLPAFTRMVDTSDARVAYARNLIASSVRHTLNDACPVAIAVPSHTGTTARAMARFKPSVWIIAFSAHEPTCQALQFSAGVHPVLVQEDPSDWSAFVRGWLAKHGLNQGVVLLTQGPTNNKPHDNYRLEILDLLA